MTYDSGAHMNQEEREEKARILNERAAERAKRAAAKRRDNIEDALLMFAVLVFGFIVGARVQAVYLDHPDPVECSSEDEVPAELTADSFDLPAGTAICIHVDGVQTAP